MAITQKSRWDDYGQEPPAGEAKYTAGEQPIAEYDNWFNKAVVDDIAALNQWLDNLGITKVYIDTEANKPASGATTELFIATDTNKIYRGTGSGWQEIPVLEWENITNKPTAFPPEAHQHTISEITDIGDASVSYADSAGDADTVDGYHASDIIAQSGARNLVDQTANRAVGTVYQNTTGRHLLVIVSIYYDRDDYSAEIQISQDNNTFTTVCKVGSNAGTYAAVAVVPPGWYYKIIAGSYYTLEYWWEVEI
ncbi:hypothetical protein [Archaeoglobus sp.]